MRRRRFPEKNFPGFSPFFPFVCFFCLKGLQRGSANVNQNPVHDGPFGLGYGQLAQRESVPLTWERSQVQSLYCPPFFPLYMFLFEARIRDVCVRRRSFMSPPEWRAYRVFLPPPSKKKRTAYNALRFLSKP